MTETQYRQLLHNRRRRGPQPLFSAAVDGRLLRQAARNLRKRKTARAELERALPSDWLEACRVEMLCDDTLVLAVRRPAVARQMQRKITSLTKTLARSIPGLKRVRIVEGAAPENGPPARTAPKSAGGDGRPK